MAEDIYGTLSTEQLEIVTAHPDDNVLVLAPPGTGKTHTVIARIKYLIEEAGLQPQELLVLCFTRAAVGEITKRIRDLIQDSQVHDDLRFVSVRTFDSYANRLLLSDDELTQDLYGKGYEDRIRMATDALQDHESSAAYIVAECRHFIVDEIQDVVNFRADLVKAIVRLADGGFTFLGDPAQAIYGFTTRRDEPDDPDPVGDKKPAELVQWVRAQNWPGGLKEIELMHNFRASGKIDGFGRAAREIVLNTDADDAAYQALCQMLEQTGSVGPGGSPSLSLLDPESSSICILCRTNGELLQIASLLARIDVRYYIRPLSTEHTLPAWIGRMLGTSRETRLSFPAFEDLWKARIGDIPDLSAEKAFGWLKRVEGGQQPVLNIRELHRRLYEGYALPDEADGSLSEGNGHLSLSTIHSAKGREFDHVIVLTPDAKGAGATGGWREEARVLYVAATRARELLSRMERDGLSNNIWRQNLPDGRYRWVTTRGGKYFTEIGIPGDVDASSFVSTYMYRHRGDALRIQDMIWSDVRPGTPLFIHKYLRGKSVFFNIAPDQSTGLEQMDMAQLSLRFKRDLSHLVQKLTGSRSFSYPNYFPGTHVTRVVTELLPPYAENVHAPFSQTGFCLGIRLHGFVPLATGGNS